MPATEQRRDSLRNRQRPCQLCLDKAASVDYKNTIALKRYLDEQGKILPRRVTGNCAEHQREVTLAIKRSRELGLN